MKDIDNYIQEKLRINQDTKVLNYHTCQPKRRLELRAILEERLKKDKDADLNDIDVSGIVDMFSLFDGLDPHNIKIDQWDVSNVQFMVGTFAHCKKFQGKGLENWDVSNVKVMSYMFYECPEFKGKCIENWNVSNVENMNSTFVRCDKFNCDLSKWNVSKLKEMQFMFYECQKFEGKGLENWNVSNTENMVKMFYRCNSLKNKPSWYKN